MFNQDYHDLLRLLSARSVNYVIVGTPGTVYQIRCTSQPDHVSPQRADGSYAVTPLT